MNGSAPDVQTLARQVARLKWLTFLLGAVVAALAIGIPAMSKDIIEAREFLVRDDQGVVRTRLHTEGLAILDEQGQARGHLLLNDGTVRLILLGPEAAQVQLAVATDGTEGLYFFDRKLRQRARLSLQDNDTVGFTLFDQNYTWRVILGVTSEGRPSITLFDPKGKIIDRMPPEQPQTAPTPAQ